MAKIISFLKKPYIAYSIISVGFLLCVAYYHKYSLDFPDSDLGLKVAAAGQMAEGKPAFFDGSGIINGVVSTPFINLLHLPFVHMSSCQIKETWFWLQMLFFAGCIFFALILTADPIKRYLLCSCIILFFISSRYWFFNLRLGQCYIIYAFLIFLLWFLKTRQLNVVFGFVLIIAIACRPLFIMPAALLTIFYFNPRIFRGLIIGASVMLLLTVVTKTISYWIEYLGAMKHYSTQVPARMGITDVDAKMNLIVPDTIFNECKKIVPEQAIFHLPAGRESGLLKPFQAYLISWFKLVITNPLFYSMVAFIISLILIFFIKRTYKQISNEKYMMLIFIIYQISEIFTPAPRGDYNYIFWLFGTALLVAEGAYFEILLLVAGLSLNHDHPRISHGREYGELLMLAGCFIFLAKKQNIPKKRFLIS